MKKFLFYLIQFTWGLPQNLVGLIGYLILYKKNRHERYQNAFFTLVDTDKSFGGISLGVFIFINGKKDENWKHMAVPQDQRVPSMRPRSTRRSTSSAWRRAAVRRTWFRGSR